MALNKFKKLSVSLITAVLLFSVIFGAFSSVLAITVHAEEANRDSNIFEVDGLKFNKTVDSDMKTVFMLSQLEAIEGKIDSWTANQEARDLAANKKYNGRFKPVADKETKLRRWTDSLRMINNQLPQIINIIKDANNGGDFDTANLLNSIIGTSSAIATMCGPIGSVVGAGIDILGTVSMLCLGGSSPTSELAQLEDRLDQQFEELKNEMATLEGLINDLSNEISASTNKIIAEMPAALDRAKDKEDVRQFLLRYEGNFSYNEFRNYIYGGMVGNSNASTAYYSYLKDALINGGSNEVVRRYYDNLYYALITNIDDLEDYMAPDADNVKSIVKTYYDYLSVNPDFASKYGMTPEEATVQFAYELYQTELMADSLILTCNTYQYIQMLLDDKDVYEGNNGNFFVGKSQIENMASAIEAREERILNQIAKDMVYVLGLNDFYLLEEEDGTFYAVSKDDSAYGNLVTGQTVYMNQIPNSVCNIFGLNKYDYTFSVNSIANDGSFKATTSNSDVVFSMLYRGEVADTVTFTVNSSAEFAGGSGTENNPYLISSKAQFLRIGENLGAYYRLTRSIDLGGIEINPFGYSMNSNGGESIEEFTGVLDGNGYTVSNFTIKGGTFAGLFCTISSEGAIENLTLENVKVESKPSNAEYSNSRFVIGTIAGENNGKIKNCVVMSLGNCGVEFSIDNKVTNRNITVCTGGVVGVNNGLVSACRVENISVKASSRHSFGGDSTNNNKNFVYVGGLTGVNNGRLGYSMVSDNVTVSATAYSILSPNTTVNSYIEALSGGICGKIGNSVSSGNMSKLYTKASTTGAATIEHDDSRWEKGYRNRKQNASSEEFCYVPSTKESVVQQMCCTSEEIVEFFSGINRELDVTIDGLRSEYAANEDEFAVDNLTVWVTDKQNPEIRYDVKESSIVGIYGFVPYNASFENARVKKVELLLKLTLENDTVMLVREYLTLSFGKNEVVSVSVEQSEKEYYVDEINMEIPLSELNGSNVTYTYLVGSDIYRFDESKLTDYTIKTEYCVHCEVCGSYNISSSLIGSNIAYECQEEGCKNTGFVAYQCYDYLYKGKIGNYQATITGKYDGNDVSITVEYTVNCIHLLDEVKYLVKDETVDATCISLGYTQYHCKSCGEVIKKSYTAKTDVHKFTADGQAKPATCYEEGFTGRIVCSVCGLVKDEGTVIPKLKHDYSEIVYEADGKTSYKHKCVNPEEDGSFHYENHQYKVTESVLRDKDTGEYYIVYTYSCDCGYSRQEEDKNTIIDENTNLPTIMVSNGYAVHGSDTVTVYVQLLNNPGIAGANFGIRYDSRLVLKSFEDGTVIAGSLTSDSNEVNFGYNFVWANSAYNAESGNLLKLEFIVPADATKGDSFGISIVYDIENGATGGFQEQGKKEAQCYITRDGRITMVDRLPGDVNDDGVVDLLDAIEIGQFLVGKKSSIDEKYANVDLSTNISGKSNVTISDMVVILQSMTGGYGVNLLSQEFQVVLNGNGFDLDDGILNVSIYDEYNNTYSRAGLKDLEREGYKFDGWWTKPVGGEQIILADGSATGVKYFEYQKQQTLYAHWTLNSVILDGNGATNNVTEPKYCYEEGYTSGAIDSHFEQEYKVIFADKSKNYQLDSVEKQLKYTLIGWALSAEDASNGTVAYQPDLSDLDLSKINLGELILYAVWDNGTLVFPDWDKSSVGYRSVQWYSNAELSALLDPENANALIKTIAQKNANVATVYAGFKPIKYTINFDANGGDGSKSSEDNHNVDQVSSLNKNTSLARIGYRFDGWSLTPDSKATIADGATVGYIPTPELQNDGTYAITLYAVWVPYKYGFNYNMNIPDEALKVWNGTKEYSVGVVVDQNLNKDTTPKYEIGKQYNLPVNTYKIVGWKFVGWSLNPDGSGTIYEDGASFTNLATCDGANETVTLYAVWEVDPYTIGSNVDNGAKVSNTQGTKHYVVYNDITRTPQSTEAGYIHIIDWSSCIRTVDYISAVKQSDGTRYGGGKFNHDIANVDEVYFIGNPDAVYTNMIIYHVNYSQYSTVPTIHFVDFNISDSALRVYTAEGMVSPHKSMIFDVEGKCSIKAKAGSDAINGFDTITFTGSGTLDIFGGKGADATEAGGNGADGGCGIVADNVIVDMTGTLNIYGGDGGNGFKGKDGSPGTSYGTGSNNDWWGNSPDGGPGTDGSNGGNGGCGGYAIDSANVSAISGSVNLYGGDGGSGADGGNGGAGGKGGGADAVGGSGGDGGPGGDGGDGGNAYYGTDAVSCSVETASNCQLTMITGDDGQVGNGGAAGARGSKGGNPQGWWGASGGSDGSPGTPGENGSYIVPITSQIGGGDTYQPNIGGGTWLS